MSYIELRRIPPPAVLFHITRAEYLASIQQQGLIPWYNQQARFDDEELARKGVYLTSDYELIFCCDSSFMDGEYLILTINAENLTLKPDCAYDGSWDEEYDQFAWYSTDIIPHSRINLTALVIVRCGKITSRKALKGMAC